MEPRSSTALTTGGLAALRRAAVMAHTVGGITLRLSARGEHLVEVRPDPAAGPSARHRVTDPCRFRMAVAHAFADFEAGREVGLVGVGPTGELDIDWAVAPPGRDLGFGAVRAGCGDRMVWAFASILDTPTLTEVMGALDDGRDDVVARAVDGLRARLVRDDLLVTTVVHVESDATGSTRILDEVLRRMVAVVGAAELLDALT
jgi:hypothetical protein